MFGLNLVPGPGSHMTMSCTSCRDYPQDDSGIVIGDDEGLPALRPNVAIIIIGLGFTLVVVVAFAVFAKFVRPHMNRQNSNNASGGSGLWEDVVKDGIAVDAKVIKTLPLVVYLAESFQGLKLDLECAVCLSQFEEGEELRLLPSCKHMFHPACIDGWLKSHPFCPLCRRNVLSTSEPEGTPFRSFEASVSQESQRSVEDHRQQSPSLEPLAEISVLERFEALRSKYYGRKEKNCSSAPEPLSQEGYLIELEKSDVVCDSSAVFSALGQGINIGASKFQKPENRDLPVSTLCISILPDVQDQGPDCSHASRVREWTPRLCNDRSVRDCSSSTAPPSSTVPASENS